MSTIPPVEAKIDGVLRGLIRPIAVPDNEKVGDVDPRGNEDYCHTISEKARAIGGGVLEAIMHHFNGSRQNFPGCGHRRRFFLFVR